MRLRLLAGGTDWMKDAACAGLNPDAFYPKKGEPQAEIQRICAGCPVRSECLDYAVREGLEDGFWGGKSEKQRRRDREQLRREGRSA